MSYAQVTYVEYDVSDMHTYFNKLSTVSVPSILRHETKETTKPINEITIPNVPSEASMRAIPNNDIETPKSDNLN